MSILDFLFPQKCLGCGRTGGYFCSQCLNFLSLQPQRICPVCEKPAIGGQTHPGCLTPQSLDGLTSIFNYKGLIKTAVAKLKYHFISDLAKDLTELMVTFLGEDKTFISLCQKKNLYLVPIPLHQRRQRWRGFNQSELLGKMMAENLDIGFAPELLVRTKNTTPQIKLKEKERKTNIQDAFQISPSSPHAPNTLNSLTLLLFDDVWTTGATLKEAAKVLKKNGAKMVWGLTIAR